MYGYVCVSYNCVYGCICGCVYVYAYNVCSIMLVLYLCVCVSICVCCMLQQLRIRSCDLNSITGDSDLYLLWTQYTGDLKTDLRVDLEIRTDSCSEDQTTIRIQNCIISCECLLLFHFLIYRCQYFLYVTCIISRDRLIYFTNMITCIILCDVSEYSLYFYSWSEHLFVSFHVSWLPLLIYD